MPRVTFLRYEGEMVLSKMVAEALRYLGSVRNYSPETLDSYQRSFDQFHFYLHSKDFPDDARSFTGDNVRGFAEYLASKKAKPSTIVVRLHALSSLAATLMKLKDARGRPYLTTNPTKTFEWPTIDQADTKFLLPDELAAYLTVKRPLRESIVRDVFVDTGMRVSEACRANVGDVIEVDGQVSIAVTVKGRGRRLRKVSFPLSKAVASAVFEWLMERGIPNPQDPKVRELSLFTDGAGQRWKRTGLGALTARIGAEAGITRFRVSPHKLRHTANVVARFGKIDPLVRSRLLGHSSPASLQRYEHVIPGELHEAREIQASALVRYLAGKGDDTPREL